MSSVFCSSRANVAFDECYEMIDQFEWHLLPAEIKRILPLILNFTQQPISGSAAVGDPETFKSAGLFSHKKKLNCAFKN